MKAEVKILIGVGALLLVFVFFMGKSCATPSAQTIAEAKYEMERTVADLYQKTLDKAIAELEAEIEEMEAESDGRIDSSNTVIANKERLIDNQTKDILTLREERKHLTEWEALAKNHERESKAWEKKFNLAQEQIIEKDKIIFSLTKKYEKRVKLDEGILTGWKEKYAKEHALRLSCELLSDEKSREIKRLKLGSTVSKVIAGLGVGFTVFSLVRK